MKAKNVKAKRIGDMQAIINKNKKPSANLNYNHIRVQLDDGREVHMLFTDAEITRAIDRAQKNPEDCPKISWIRDILD